ncbi:Protein translocase subunit SecD [hydrothermal vent metagenome]|uniref:Protein translocase subunit SecD n=1 Tax=hydrothermal vent metagenome TaxID=652676 RepID=A0A3B0RDN2_9ZZZZ
MLYFSKAKQISIWLVIVLGMLFALPNFLPEDIRGSEDVKGRLPVFIPSKTVNLGLDLQGGSYLLFEVDIDSVRKSKMESTQEEARQLLRGERPILPARNFRISGKTVSFKLSRPEQLEMALKRLETLNEISQTQLLSGNTNRPFVITSDADTGRISITVTDDTLTKQAKDAVVRSVEVIRKRITELGTKDPTILRQGNSRIIVEVPGESDPVRIKRIIEKTAQMSFHMVDSSVSVGEALAGRVPPGAKLVKTTNPGEPDLLIQRRSLVDGGDLINAQQTFNQSGQPAVSFTFNSRGALRFGNATAKNVGRRFAILLDDESITAPVIRSPILGGTGIIDGGFTVEGANDLAVLLRAGALPAKLDTLNERSVGPGLGQDSIRAGSIALLIGFVAVMIYMMLAYGRFGLFANTALVANVVLILGALSGLQATLTLPGIAGVILTIGMAVDANVLIFERIREELAIGRTPLNAVETGFAKARSTILDANITTLIAAMLLLLFGSGPVQGFGVTLAIGIFTSVFTAFLFSRMLTSYWLMRARPKTLSL